MTTKITKRDMFIQIKSHLTDPTEIAFIDHQIELLDRKNASNRKPTANQVENENFLEVIVNILNASEKAMSISDIQAMDPELPTSNQRMSALMKKLVDSGVVEKIYEKRKPYFKAVG